MSAFDPCLFFWNNSEWTGLIAIHVDDFWVSGTKIFVSGVSEAIKHEFCVGKVANLPCKYLGLHIEKRGYNLVIDQNEYTNSLEEAVIDGSLPRSKELDDDEKSTLRSIIGRVLWPAVHSRPDISFTVSNIGAKIPIATIGDLYLANKIVRRLKNDVDCEMKYVPLGDPQKWILIVFSDASMSNNYDGSTHGGYFVFPTSTQTFASCLLSWKSAKLKRIARSTLSAEALACIDGVDSALLLKRIIFDIIHVQVPITVLTDNASLVDSVFSTKLVSDKRLRIDISYLKSLVDEQNIQRFSWIPTRFQLADCLTKSRSTAQSALIDTLKSSRLDLDVYLKEFKKKEEN